MNQTATTPTLDALRAAIAEPPIEYRPELRWWLAAGLHTNATISREIAAAHRLGFGGMEFLAMPEENVDSSCYGWGSEEWTHDSHTVVAETTARGMSFSFTSGTNWSNANLPTITPDDPAASQELDVEYEDVRGRRTGLLPRIDLGADRGEGGLPGSRIAPRRQHLVAVVAAVIVDSGTAASTDVKVIDVGTLIDLTPLVTGNEGTEALEWRTPDARDWRLFVFWMHGTGQTASPSASVNYTVNYLDRDGVDAVIDYWREVILTDSLKAHIARNPRAQMYMDSLELNTWGEGGMFWGRCVPEEFRARRGYDVTPWLPLLVRSAPLMAVSTRYRFEPEAAYATEVAKVRHDYVATLTDLYIEHMLQPFADFLHEEGITLRAEISYGLPFELTRPGVAVDGIETESLEFGSQIDAYRLMAGPAHLLGKQYSSETGATTRNHMLPHRFYDQIINTQLAAGITKTVLHGWSSPAGAEGSTEWPGHEGMLPMFSERFDTRQPAAEFYPLWNRAIGRVQQVLRRGRPRIDVGILRTDHFTDNSSGMMFYDGERRIPDEVAYGRRWMRDRDNHWWRDLGMQDAGWGYEFFDGSLLLREDVVFADGVVQPDGPGYQALIVYQEALDADVAARLLEWARRRAGRNHGGPEDAAERCRSGRPCPYRGGAARTGSDRLPRVRRPEPEPARL
ncbi:glycosyl hydrolase [Actinomyces sp.]|uniref:glycosyl hydrolase n=1 Tax=Actinomyces sp. TaxID=29317 RepID=UPI0026DAF160|nr:glycosyl hydrolase [Actinomyces sp.]MDO4900510.1 glycosyl hydrolase [Actinomyces sp.]